MWPNLQFPVDLVTFTEEIVNEKLHFLCSDISNMQIFLKIHEYKNNTCINFWYDFCDGLMNRY